LDVVFPSFSLSASLPLLLPPAMTLPYRDCLYPRANFFIVMLKNKAGYLQFRLTPASEYSPCSFSVSEVKYICGELKNRFNKIICQMQTFECYYKQWKAYKLLLDMLLHAIIKTKIEYEDRLIKHEEEAIIRKKKIEKIKA
jgi:hypothetical protein